MLNLISIQFLEREIARFDDEPHLKYDNPFYYSLAKKELMLLEKLAVEYSDFTGTIQELEKRLGNQRFFLLDPQNVLEMKEKSQKYETIKEIMREN